MEYHIAVDRSTVRVSAVEKRPGGVYRVKSLAPGFQLYCEDDFRRNFKGAIFIENETGGFLVSPLPKTGMEVFSIHTMMKLPQHNTAIKDFFHFTREYLTTQMDVYQLSEDSTFVASKGFGLVSHRLYPLTGRIAPWAKFQSDFLNGKTLLLGSSSSPNDLLDRISVLERN